MRAKGPKRAQRGPNKKKDKGQGSQKGPKGSKKNPSVKNEVWRMKSNQFVVLRPNSGWYGFYEHF